MLKSCFVMRRLYNAQCCYYCASRQRKKKMPVLLRISCASNLILSLIVLFVQSMILSSCSHLKIKTYTQYTGVGIWTALLLACNGISILLYFKRKFLCEPSQMYMASLVICVATLLAGIVMAGLSSAAFYGLLSKFTTESPLPQTAFVLAQLDDEFASLKVLEGTLFGCGLASIFVNALSILFLRLNNQIISHEAMISSSILSASNANRY